MGRTKKKEGFTRLDPRRVEAFTLLELVVAMAITLVIAAFVFTFTNSLVRLWNTSESGVDTELDAQIALDTIARDLESAIFLEKKVSDGEGAMDPVVMFAVSTIAMETADTNGVDRDFSGRWVDPTQSGSGRPATLHFDPPNHHYGWAGLWMRFFSAAPSLNAIGYQIIRRPAFSDSNEPRYLLHRAVVRQDETLAAGFDILDTAYVGTTSSDVDSQNVGSPRLQNFLLEDVIDFGVRLYVYDNTATGSQDAPDGLRLIFPSSNNFSLDENENEFHHFASSEQGSYDSRYPDVVEVFIRVVDDVGSEILFRNEEEEYQPGYYERVLEDHSRVYRRMIRIPGREPR